MSSLEEVYEGDGRWHVALTAGLFLLGIVAAVGFVAAATSLVAGFGVSLSSALKFSATLTGVLLSAAFLALPTPFGRGGRSVVAVGVVLVGAGLALFWVGLPAGWRGDLSALPRPALVVYAVGLLAVLQADFALGNAGRESPSVVKAVTVTDADRRRGADARRDGPSAPTADGGAEDDDLRFFDDAE
ncbi:MULTISPECIES: DUF7139 domain-containing protein [Halorussus]|uniref:DUF7139 domain-containing protein n=1 Tax=Halorussus TaxID=1070314 RepID=UPI00209CC1E6|nr:hypothetical protein [Halorussus vallis]USZ76379.1 hypothetical protein NGM07_03395 [Halorussus vallis]